MSTDVVSASEPVDLVDAPGSGPSSDPSSGAPAPDPPSTPAIAQDHPGTKDQIECARPAAPVFLHSPPDSNDATKSDASDSELSELEDEPVLDDALSAATSATAPAPAPSAAAIETYGEEDDIGQVLPDEWSGAVPIFRPSWHQFKDFKKFMNKVDCYGMKSGIIKIIPPKEWKDAQPPLDDLVKHIRVREPIKQDIMGSNGTYRQVNILHGRSYNVPQWRQLCEQSEHQPPARRGERRANAERPKYARQRPAPSKSAHPSTPKKRGRGRPAKNKGKKTSDDAEERLMTPVSPRLEPEEGEEDENKPVKSIEQDADDGTKDCGDETAVDGTAGRVSGAKSTKPKTQSVSARRKYSRREGSAMIDEAAFKDFDYRLDISEYTPERCEELERAYWKTLTYAPPLYGADMMGTLFDERTETWNLNKLPNLLDVLGTKIPGVNTAYLYLGMWKATFAWHLEDVDLYSINYLHFGAPKQWYSISQADARRFEAAMKSVWPADAKACSQFLRHKGFLISPQHLLQHYGIKVNKVVSYPGEFVVTYPYGYHSGYNLGYNCAEAVNFALDTWLEMGKIAKRCECAQAQDSVWINVYEIERKIRGEETEYEETDEDDEDEDDEELSGLPTPPASLGVKFKAVGRKRKRGAGDKVPKAKLKKIKLRFKAKAEPPCCLCPNAISFFDVLSTDDGRKAHKLCASYIPETYIETVDGNEVICNVGSIHKDRLSLKCLFCRSRRGACFQCSHKKCARGYHATCAAAAGVFVEDQDVPVFDANGTEYKEQAFEFSCRFHRTKRDKKVDGDVLEEDARIRRAARQLATGEMCQIQYLKGDIFAGVVVENREHEETLLIDVLPHGDRLEVDWKWLLLPDPSDFHLPKASPNALPMPTSRQAKDALNTKRLQDDKPRKDDVFAGSYTWAEFEAQEVRNGDQAKVNFDLPNQIWHYLGKTSTEARAQFTEDPARQQYNPRGNFLDTIPKPPKPTPASRPMYHHQSYVAKAMAYSYNLAANFAATAAGVRPVSLEKPYVYKPRKSVDVNVSQPLAPTPPQTYAKQVPMPYHQSHAGTVLEGVPHGANYQSPNYSQPQSIPHQDQRGSAQGVCPSQEQNDLQSNSATAPVPSDQPCKPSWQVHSSIYPKYPFFQVHHNRDPSKYRTPYSTHGGFTNGYEGNLRAHLMSNPNALTSHEGVTWGRAQERANVQTAAMSKPVRAAKSFKVPAKVSPVPLPPHVLAAMARTRPVTSSLNRDSSRAITAGPATAGSAMQPSTTMGKGGDQITQIGSETSNSSWHQTQGRQTELHSQQVAMAAAKPMSTASGFESTQEFADVPGSESMEFVEKMMQNLRRASLNEGTI